MLAALKSTLLQFPVRNGADTGDAQSAPRRARALTRDEVQMLFRADLERLSDQTPGLRASA